MTVAAILASPSVPVGSGTSYSFAASLSPTTLSQTGTTSTIVTASTCTTTATGGTPPYSYAWTFDDAFFDNVDNVVPVSPSAAATTFRKSSCVSGNDYSGLFHCTVTDALGSKAVTGDVSITITRT